MLRDRVVVESHDPGALHVAILAAVHGNERAGFFAFDRLFERLHRERLLRGRLSLVPGNLRAAGKKHPTRSAAGQDMNRLFLEPHEVEAHGLVPQGPDWERARELALVLRDVDVLLDLHSTSTNSKPFLVTQRIDDTIRSLASGFPVDRVDYDYQRCVPGTTMQWVERHGGRGLTVECGEHRRASSSGGKVAYACAVALLRNLRMLGPGPTEPSFPSTRVRLVHRGLVRHPPSLRYEHWFRDGALVEPGVVVARDQTGNYRAPTREALEQALGASRVPDRLIAVSVLRPSRVAQIRPPEGFLLGIRE